MSALMLGPDEKQKIASLVQLATEQALSFEAMRDLAFTEKKLPDYLSITLSTGYTVGYSVEQQPDKKMYHHLSVQMEAPPHKGPSPEVVAQFMKEFGFDNNLEDCMLWEGSADNGSYSVNVMELLVNKLNG